jgi:hypothetical protein
MKGCDSKLLSFGRYVLLVKKAAAQRDLLSSRLQTMDLKCTEVKENLSNEHHKLSLMQQAPRRGRCGHSEDKC